MGCMQVCEDQPKKVQYDYKHQLKFIKETISQIIYFKKNFNIQFVSKCYQQICHSPKLFILKYPKKIQEKQSVPVNILQKWKMILYGSGYEDEAYIAGIGYNNTSFQEQKFNEDRTFKLLKQNPFQIDLNQLYYHQSYTQIQKDIVRKYEIPQLKQESFQRILKKISNYFPSTGYALGINYIIGYFLIIGYSEIDSFWLFVHLALNKRFLALGLFEQGFPLAKILILIFKNIIKRTNRAIYQHIFQKMLIDDSMWILKWFMSFYLSSFPIEACQYVWDLTFATGILGLVYFGVSLIESLVVKILNLQDEGDIIILFKSLNNIQTFNELINIQKVMSLAYSISVEQEDFQNIETLKKDFYSSYFQLFRQQLKKQAPKNKLVEKQNKELSQFYKQILLERNKFKDLARQSASKFYQPLTNQRQLSNSQKKSQNICENSVEFQQIDKNSSLKQQQKRQVRSVQNQQISHFEQKLQQKQFSPIKMIKSQILNNDNNQKINKNSLLSLVPNKSQSHFASNNIKQKFRSQKQFKSLKQQSVSLQIKNANDFCQNNQENLQEKVKFEDQIKKQINKQCSYVSSQIKVKSVKNQNFSQDELQNMQEEVSRIQDFLTQNKQNSKNQIKSKPQLQIQDVEESNKSIPKQHMKSVEENFVKNQPNQGIQSQFHISIYNIQDQKERFQQGEKVNQTIKSTKEAIIQKPVEDQIKMNKSHQQYNQIQKIKQNIFPTAQNIQNVSNVQIDD